MLVYVASKPPSLLRLPSGCLFITWRRLVFSRCTPITNLPSPPSSPPLARWQRTELERQARALEDEKLASAAAIRKLEADVADLQANLLVCVWSMRAHACPFCWLLAVPVLAATLRSDAAVRCLHLCTGVDVCRR